MSSSQLRLAALGLIAGFVIHNGDHARRGLDAVRESVVWGGTFAIIVATVVVTLVLTNHRLAPAAAAAGGFAIALGVSASHLLPDWGPLSDALPGGDVDALTWVAVLSEIVAAAWLGWVGVQLLRTNDYALQPKEFAR